jgi:hypothetical protein
MQGIEINKAVFNIQPPQSTPNNYLRKNLPLNNNFPVENPGGRIEP